MKHYNRSEKQKGCAEIIDEDIENALSDYEDSVRRTNAGKYRCRDCGMIFNTLEEHDLHHRTVHRKTATIPLSGMPM